jgi:hypothetical protein
MGYPMAVNLRKKMNTSAKILVCDVSQDQIAKYKSALSGEGEIEVVKDGAEAARRAVSKKITVYICGI